jgi:hypothetical protein
LNFAIGSSLMRLPPACHGRPVGPTPYRSRKGLPWISDCTARSQWSRVPAKESAWRSRGHWLPKACGSSAGARDVGGELAALADGAAVRPVAVGPVHGGKAHGSSSRRARCMGASTSSSTTSGRLRCDWKASRV